AARHPERAGLPAARPGDRPPRRRRPRRPRGDGGGRDPPPPRPLGRGAAAAAPAGGPGRPPGPRGARRDGPGEGSLRLIRPTSASGMPYRRLTYLLPPELEDPLVADLWL